MINNYLILISENLLFIINNRLILIILILILPYRAIRTDGFYDKKLNN